MSDYDYENNLLKLLRNKEAIVRVRELMITKLLRNYPIIENLDLLNDAELLNYFLEMFNNIDPHLSNFIDFLCTWQNQPEGSGHWSTLHRMWQEISGMKIELEEKPRLYKSIW